MNKTVAKRGRAKGGLTLLATFAESITDTTSLAILEFRLKKLDETWEEFVFLQNELLEYIDTENYLDREPEFVEYQAKLRKNTKEDNTSIATSQDSEVFMSQSPSSTVHLPKIIIPPFSGDYKDWPAFRDLFTGTIDSNTNLTCTQKLHYLKSFLSGDAATLLRHISCSEQNYIEAWDRLEKRYNQKNLIVQSFVSSFLALPSCLSPSIHLLRKITDGADETIRGLHALDCNTRDPWLIYLLLQKLDYETKQAWAEEVSSGQDCTIDRFLNFLQMRCSCLESCLSFSRPNQIRQKSTNAVRTHLVEFVQECPKCQESHTLSNCEEFKSLNVDARREFTKLKSLCFNCLRKGHSSNKCLSNYRCRQCKSRHHTLVHPAEISPQDIQNSFSFASTTEDITNSNSEEPIITNQALESNSHFVTILPTALIQIQDKQGIFRTFRALLDSGSQVSFVTEHVAQYLGLPRKHSRIPIIGISSTPAGVTNGLVTLKLHSCINSAFIQSDCYVLPKIASSLSSVVLKELPTLALSSELADPHFYRHGTVDILLGADKIFNIITGVAKEIYSNGLISIPTIFGLVIAGRVSNISKLKPEVKTYCTRLDNNLDFDLEKFWRLENVSHETPLSLEEQLAEEDFTKNTIRRRNDGKFEVSLPFKPLINLDFGDSLKTAMNRFYSLERRLNSDSALKSQYSSFINEYLNLGHMEEIPLEEVLRTSKHLVYYLPHHPVFKGDSSTTKVRVVFDASAKSDNKTSLNETLLVGPTLQKEIFTICLRSRCHDYLITGDIEKMYRQIWVSPRHTDFQRIVWRESPNEPLRHFRLLTVTYGTASAPFLAVRALKQLALDSAKTHPRASAIILKDFYVDDVVTGADTVDEVIALRFELIQLLRTAGMNLRKWTSNCWPLLVSLPEDQREFTTFDFEQSNSIKMLGLQWNPFRDCFSYKVRLSSSYGCTKRRILSDASRIFDPLGFLSPIIIAIKIMFQELWRKNLKWDDEVPEVISLQWNIIRKELPLVESFAVPRVMVQHKLNWELHGFCDASLDAYSAVVYCRSVNEDNSVSVTLVAAKTKVAPLKVLPLPRLELSGALLLTRLLNRIKTSLLEPDMKIFAWTDSSIVLHWLQAAPKKWSVFIANRTSKILTSIPFNCWNHVSSAVNPADVATRGITPSTLANTDLWWKGPQWLSQHKDHWKLSKYNTDLIDTNQLEERKVSVAQVLSANTSVMNELDNILTYHRNWMKSVRVVAYIYRFFKNSRTPNKNKHERNYDDLSTKELDFAQLLFIKNAQCSVFKKELDCLRRVQELPSKNRLLSLTPFIDFYGVLRVGGRIEYSDLSYSEKHPIILCKTHPLAKILIEYIHKTQLHPGASLLFSFVRHRFYILGCRNIVRKVVHECVVCFKQKQTVCKQLMGNLPMERIRYSRPFKRVGCDYAGPIMIRVNRGRNPRFEKAYIALFVCFVTKAIHLELVGDLSSKAFLLALDRFVSRRGKPTEIWSDNGTNFHGAKRQLDELQKLLCDQQHKSIIVEHLSRDNVQWKFIPPSSPHFGGLWESGVKSVKLHLKRVIGESRLTYEDLYTLLTKIEAILNSRPLWPTSDQDPAALTPSHFLIGETYIALPQPDVSLQNVSIKSNWYLLQAMLQGFWQRWHNEFLTSLQQRPKWQRRTPNIQVDDVVLIKEPNLPPAKWILGRIRENHLGPDNRCRVVTIRTQYGDYVRPITKIARLPLSETP